METGKVATHIINWLRDYAESAHANGFIIGISGGIDSAVVSTLCAHTGLPTLCMEMPIHQAPAQVSRGLNHIAWLKRHFSQVRKFEVPLTPVFDSLAGVLPEGKNLSQQALALANTRARLRMTTLYYMATLHGCLVAGTGNKIEDFGIGFFTKYGDGGVDISPIADLTKTEVYEMGAFLGINQDIMEALPTDGLWEDERTDEQQIGASYKELEWAMAMAEAGKKAGDFEGRQTVVFSIFERLHTANLHKMIPIPVCHIPKEYR